MPKTKDPETLEFETALLRSVDQALAGEGRVTTGAEIAKRSAGRPVQTVHKQPVTLRLDPEVLARWRASGKGWQTRMAEVLGQATPAAS
ncbi:MAG: BrnA antitoxin family protein [Proteobacteria bacterium]|nr:BrnA antitoxin family protein [Pseudomonadota bacterium]MBS0494339.1 BrnA antitoxin family protein [Pseudomonadota bacterium]